MTIGSAPWWDRTRATARGIAGLPADMSTLVLDRADRPRTDVPWRRTTRWKPSVAGCLAG